MSGTAKKTYTNRESITLNHSHVGDIARFGPNDWRCSSHPNARSFETRQQAIDHLKARTMDGYNTQPIPEYPHTWTRQMAEWLIDQHATTFDHMDSDFALWVEIVIDDIVESWGDTSKLDYVRCMLTEVGDDTGVDLSTAINMVGNYTRG